MKQAQDIRSRHTISGSKSSSAKGSFRGWYFKHQLPARTVAFIPGFQISPDGTRSAFLQIITNNRSEYISFPYESFSWQKSPLKITLG